MGKARRESDMDWIVRGLVALWGLFFVWMGVSGLIDPGSYVDTFGVHGDAMAMNTIRADFSAFFLVAGGAAGWAALRPEHAKMLWLPAGLFAIALAGRILGVMLGDPFAGSVRESVIVEGMSALLLMAAYVWLARRHPQGISVSLS